MISWRVPTVLMSSNKSRGPLRCCCCCWADDDVDYDDGLVFNKLIQVSFVRVFVGSWVHSRKSPRYDMAIKELKSLFNCTNKLTAARQEWERFPFMYIVVRNIIDGEREVTT